MGFHMSSEEDKPKATGGTFASINSSKSGARTTRDLPKGDHPIQLYSLATPNGQKITLALQELGVKYDAFMINIMKGDQFTSGFVEVNPNSKIPAMIDRDGPGGKEIRLFESGSILLYLAEKYGKLIPSDPALKVECMNWLFFQVGAGPYFGQFGHFYKYAPEKIEYSIKRYSTETKRLLDVLDKQLANNEYLAGSSYTIADIAWFPWVGCIRTGYSAWEYLEVDSYKNVVAWFDKCCARPASTLGMKINTGSDDGKYRNYSTDGNKE